MRIVCPIPPDSIVKEGRPPVEIGQREEHPDAGVLQRDGDQPVKTARPRGPRLAHSRAQIDSGRGTTRLLTRLRH